MTELTLANLVFWSSMVSVTCFTIAAAIILAMVFNDTDLDV